MQLDPTSSISWATSVQSVPNRHNDVSHEEARSVAASEPRRLTMIFFFPVCDDVVMQSGYSERRWRFTPSSRTLTMFMSSFDAADGSYALNVGPSAPRIGAQ